MAATSPVIYRSGLTDSSRWAGFAFRPGDIVISTPSKCGTTWMQMICALLIFQSADLPGPLTAISPWLDMRLRPVDEVMGLLDAQRHRRFIKTHTPLDGLPLAAGVHYVTVGRDPLDVAVSFDHHRANLDREVFEALQARAPEPTSSSRPAIGAEVGGPAGQRERLLQWIRDERPPAGNLDSLRAVVRHLGGAWARRPDPAFTLVHYNDLSRRLDQQMRGLAARLDITVAEDRWPGLAQAATFGRMRARADDLVPDERLGLFADRDKFFRSGTSRQWRTTLTDQDLEDYRRLLRSLTSPEIVAWLEYGDSGAAE